MEQEQSTTDNKSYNRANIIVIILSVILAVVITLFILQRADYTKIVDQMDQDRDSLQVELNTMVAGYDSLQTENDNINANMELAATRVRALADEIYQVKEASYEQINKYKNEVGTMRKIMQNFYVQIDSLNRKNEELMNENREIKQENRVVRTENVTLTKEKNELEKKMTIASALEAGGLNATGITSKGKSTSLIRRAKQIKVNFSLNKNIAAKRGTKYIYMRIMKPDQTIFTTPNRDKFLFENKRIEYSATRKVTYEGKELPVNIFWDNREYPKLQKGEYRVDVFLDGNNIGTTKFTLK